MPTVNGVGEPCAGEPHARFDAAGAGNGTDVLRNRATPVLQAEREHRHHAVVEQVIADSKASALAHLPSGHFRANAAWLTLWAMAYNLLRATGTLASAFHAKATTATLRAHLVQVPARLARSARRLTLHLPQRWPWRDAWMRLFDTVHRPPKPA